jgi:two-component system KDP operon response regulator KdpE
LVVEDDSELRDLYRIELTMAGYNVSVVADGLAALEWIELERPDAILLDLGLPRLGGHDVQRELAAHAETRDIPIILVTGLTGEQGINPADFWCVIRKPIDPAELVKAVKKCIPPSRGFWSFR